MGFKDIIHKSCREKICIISAKDLDFVTFEKTEISFRAILMPLFSDSLQGSNVKVLKIQYEKS